MAKLNNTKEKILAAALDLFSKNGFSAVSVRQIASAVGIKESSLYCHFKNKRDILDNIIEGYAKMNENYLPDFSKKVEVFLNITEEQFLEEALKSFNTYMMNDSVLKFFRVMSIERFNSEEINKLYVKCLIDDPIQYQSELFKALMENGKMKNGDERLLAIEFYSPIFLMLQRYFLEDFNADKIDFAREIILEHCLSFWRRNNF